MAGEKALTLSGTTNTKIRELTGSFSCGNGQPEARETALDICRRTKRHCALIVDSKWNESHEASHLLSHRHLHRPNDKMKLPKFLHIPKIHRRTRSKARSEISPIESQSEVGLAAPRPTGSIPDLRIVTSTLSMPSPLIFNDQKTNGM